MFDKPRWCHVHLSAIHVKTGDGEAFRDTNEHIKVCNRPHKMISLLRLVGIGELFRGLWVDIRVYFQMFLALWRVCFMRVSMPNNNVQKNELLRLFYNFTKRKYLIAKSISYLYNWLKMNRQMTLHL